MTSGSLRSRAWRRRSTAAPILGRRNGSANCLSRGCRKPAMEAGSLRPRFSRHWASSGGMLGEAANCTARSGWGGASDQRNFILAGLGRLPRLPALLLTARGSDGQNDGNQQDAGDYEQGYGGGYIDLKPAWRAVVGVEQHLHSHKHQHEGQAVFQVAEVANGARQEEVERTQAENGKDVRGEDDERLPRHGEDGRDGIHGKEQVAGLNHHEHQRQGGERFAAFPLSHEPLAVKLWREGIEFSPRLDHAIVLRMLFGLEKEHPEAAVEEEGAEDIEHPIEQGDEGNAQADHQAAHDESAKDARSEEHTSE